MKYWAHKVFAGYAQLIGLCILTCAVPAFAQFEVSPDHFDAPTVEKKQAAKTPVKKTGGRSAKAGKCQPQIAAAGNNAQASSVSSGRSQGYGESGAPTNASAAKPNRYGEARSDWGTAVNTR